MKKVAIVTGGSSGIGRCAAGALRDAGCIVYEFSRRENPQVGVVHIQADVTDQWRDVYKRQKLLRCFANSSISARMR